MSKKTYRVHYEQINQGWVEVEASSVEAAVNKAKRLMREIHPTPDCIELPNGEQKEVDEP